MLLHHILPSLHQSSSRRRRSRCSRIGQPSHQTWTSLSMSGVGWKRKHGWWKPKNLDELWEACKTAFFAIPDDFINNIVWILAKPHGCSLLSSWKSYKNIKFGSHRTTTSFAGCYVTFFVFEVTYLFNYITLPFCRQQNFCLAKIWPSCLH